MVSRFIRAAEESENHYKSFERNTYLLVNPLLVGADPASTSVLGGGEPEKSNEQQESNSAKSRAHQREISLAALSTLSEP